MLGLGGFVLLGRHGERVRHYHRLVPRLTALAALFGVLAACSPGSAQPATLTEATLRYVDRAQGSDGGRYQQPGPRALEDLPRSVWLTAQRGPSAEPLLERHGYTTRPAGESGRVRLLVPEDEPDERGWGLYAVRPGGRRVVVEVPHPRADLETERLGAQLAERLQAEYLLVAGARRDRSGGEADVAHREASVFAAVHASLAERGLPAVQLHGFAEESSPDNDVVVSPGGAALSPLVRRVATELDRGGFRTCRVWTRECGQLEGRTNVQSAASARAPFAHVEVSRAVRDDRRERLVAALAAAVDATVPPLPHEQR